LFCEALGKTPGSVFFDLEGFELDQTVVQELFPVTISDAISAKIALSNLSFVLLLQNESELLFVKVDQVEFAVFQVFVFQDIGPVFVKF
jgi:hypothetical protein